MMLPIRYASGQSTCGGHAQVALGTSAKCQQRKWPLFDHLVGDCHDAWWNSQAQCPCRLQVDHEFKFRHLDDRKISRPSAFQYSARVNAGFAMRIHKIGGIANQTASYDEFALTIDHRYRRTRP